MHRWANSLRAVQVQFPSFFQKDPMSKLKQILTIAALLPSVAFAAETITQPVKQFRYDAEADYLYVVGTSAWGSGGCPNATYVTIKPTVAGRKQLFASIAYAHASGKTVRFQGVCSANLDHFDATYIVVE